MFIKRINIPKYKVLNDIDINLQANSKHNVFPIISTNGGGKSTLLQFVFTLLHCAFNENRHQYLGNFLTYLKNIHSERYLNKLATFELKYNDMEIRITFVYSASSSVGYEDDEYLNFFDVVPGLDFTSIIDLEELMEKKEQINQSIRDIDLLVTIKNDLLKSNRLSPLLLNELQKFVSNSKEKELLNKGVVNYQLDFINRTIKNLENSLIGKDELNLLISKAKKGKSIVDDFLVRDKLKYICHFNENRNVLLCYVDVEDELLKEISDRIYLATPSTQVLHFLDDEKLSSLFTNSDFLRSSYEYNVSKCQEDLKGLFTYEFSYVNLIVAALKKARDNDFGKALETGNYGTQLSATIEELNNLLSGKIITVDKDLTSISFKTKGTNIPLSPKDLSHGELKKLSIYAWLKATTKDNSIILMDEVDIGLHPTWQHELHNDLQKWNLGSQFILATHSPQIISNTHYKNLVVLSHNKKGATAEQFNEAPIESDLNTIVKTIMGGEYIPKEIAELRKKYRELFEANKLDTKEAQDVKKELLNYESENSSFFQDIKFQMELL